jgi:hypothetical protein
MQQPNLTGHLQKIQAAITGPGKWVLGLIILLMPVNWGIEARKWQLSLRSLHAITYRQAFRAILSGVSFSLNTPNRIGEYGGRILFLPEGKRARAVSLTIAASFSQLLITLTMGAAGLFVISERLLAEGSNSNLRVWITVFRSVVIFFACTGFLIYFRMSWLLKGIGLVPGMKKLLPYISVLEDMDFKVLLRVLVLSGVRFLVFLIQYNLMLQLMDVQTGWWTGLWTVSVLFLLLATLPTVALLELGLRWEYSVMLFSPYSSNTVGILASATGIWLINLVLPAIIGSLFILGVRIFREP